MTGGRTSGVSLSTRVTAVTFVAVTLSVLLISGLSVAGVYNLVRVEDEYRLSLFTRLIADGVHARLAVVDRVVDAAASQVTSTTSDPATLRAILARSSAANVEYLDLMAFTKPDGTVVAASSGEAPRSFAAAYYVPRDLSDAARLGYQFVPEQGRGRLWIARRVGGESGLVLVCRLKYGFMTALVNELSSSRDSVSTMIVDGDGRIVRWGSNNTSVTASSLAFKASNGGLGSAEARAASGGHLVGTYQDLFLPGLTWRAVTFESDQAAMTRAWRALLPAGLSAALVTVLAVVLALAYSRRLVYPLRQLERRAREVASGGYIRPVEVSRDDEIGRVADAFNEMGVRLNSLQDLAQLLASASSLDDLLDSVLNAAGHILGTGDAAILLTDQDASALVLARGRGLAYPAATLMVPFEQASPITEAFHERRPAAFRGQGGDWTAPIHRLFGADAERAGVVVPLVMGRDVLGVIVVLAPGHRAFTEAQIETVRAFSANAAVAVRNSRLFEHEHLSRTEAEALRDVAEQIVRPANLGPALEKSARIAADLLEMEGCTLAVRGREQLGLAPAPDARAEADLLRAWALAAPRPDGGDAPRFDPVPIPEVAAVPGLAALLGPGVGSALLIPLVQGAAARGVLALTDRAPGRAPTSRQAALAGTIGKELSLAIRNAHLLQQARSRAANLETVFRISQAVSSELQINVVLNRVLDVVQKIFTADAVALMSYDQTRRVISTSMARGVSNREMLYFEAAPGVDIPGQVFETRTPSSHGDLTRMSTPLARLATSQGLHSVIAVPLLARGKSIGVLAVYGRDADAFSGEDMELLLTFASQAALAIDTASLYGREHTVASVLQAAIIPERIAPVPGLRIGSFYLPAGAEAEIGGDYYDVFTTRDGRVVAAIGDVCGKGVAAATKTSMIKYALRGLLSAGMTPGGALEELNHLVAVSGDPSDIVTAWVGVVDVAAGRLVYANAGHPPALLRHGGTSRMARLGPTGPLLGAVAGVGFDDVGVDLERGDTLLLYTDGVTEARRQTRFFGEGRVRRTLRRADGPERAVDDLLAAVREFSNGPLRDDAAALAVQYEGLGAAPEAESRTAGPDAGLDAPGRG